MGDRMEYSENNSVIFSRISVILGVGNTERRKVSDGDVGVQESMFSIVPRVNSRPSSGKKEPHIRVLARFVGVDGLNYGAKNSSM
jgi:hypothetical protein